MLFLLNRKRRGCKNPNHPSKGSAIKVEPIRDKQAIQNIKQLLGSQLRDLLLFTMGINTAFRANELLSLKVGQVRGLEAGSSFEIKLSKTKTYRRVTINAVVVETVARYLAQRNPDDNEWLFKSGRKDEPLQVSTVSRYVKKWCSATGLRGNYASHTLRKTWGFMQRTQNKTPIPLLMVAYGHSTQRQTLSYLCIQHEEIAGIYMNLLL